ncbi:MULTISPECIES: twin-arginine translocation signal domain-containing protein [Halorussus]|uniref:twin-arginine translocation signal domain-containing protein n=1 Tax=Halorussus TaxID=1070314 RepID=UPI00209ECE00|nr:twin-arginine translocation signal domain-containing protein [Halorussus vallis]USZ74135.1 twin-arginine translocation signal domain-containing protein [Halorussus vallis]
MSRRTVLKRSALAAGAVGLGGSAVTTGAGQEDSPTSMRALMYLDQVYSLARFQVVSPSLDWTPEFGSLPENVPRPINENYQTRVIKYQNTNERVLFFPRADAEIDESVTYALTNVRGFAADDPNERINRVVQVRFSPASEVDWPGEENGTTTGGQTTTPGAGGETNATQNG